MRDHLHAFNDRGLDGMALVKLPSPGKPTYELMGKLAAPDAEGEPVGQLNGTTSALDAAPDTMFNSVPSPGAPAGDTDFYLKESVFLQSFAQDLPAATAKALWARGSGRDDWPSG